MTMVTAAVYRPTPAGSTSGPILWMAHCDDSVLSNLGKPYVMVGDGDGVTAATHSIVSGAAVALPAMSLTASGLVVSGIPEPAMVWDPDGAWTYVTGGSYTATEAGQVKVKAPGYLDGAVTVS